MAIWVGKQKMSCRSCIKGHRSSTCNHIGGPLWAVRPAGRPNKACIHGPSDLCLCAHYFPLTWLKAAVPRKQKCSCQRPGSGSKKCCCGSGGGAASSSPPEDDTQPIFYQDLVARGLHVTTEPVDMEAAPLSIAAPPAPSSCCSAPVVAQAPVASSCCSGPRSSASSTHAPAPAPVPVSVPVQAPAQSSCCGGGAVKSENSKPPPPATNGHIKTESMASAAPFTPIQQFQSLPDFPVMKFSPVSHGTPGGDHVCECGETCNCVLCIDHPYNNATMNHIATEFGQMMSNGAQFSPPTSGNGTNGHRPDLYAHYWADNGMFPPGFSDPSIMGGHNHQQHQQPQQSHSPPQQATDLDIILNPADFQMFNFAFPPMEEGGEEFESSGLDMGGSLEAMPGLMDLNSFCGGATEVCPCGDDCACIGCQIHKPTNGNGLVNGVGPPVWS